MQTRSEEGSGKQLREELDSLRRSITRKIHLASLQARNEWIELEAKTKEFQRELRVQRRNTRRALVADATALIRRLREFIEQNLRTRS